MSKYADEIKCNNKSFRFTNKVFNYINNFDGNGLNQKLENLVLFCMEKEVEKKKEIDELQKEVEKLVATRSIILDDIRNLENSKKFVASIMDNLEQLDTNIKGDVAIIGFRSIEQEITKEGFIPNKKLVLNMDKLNRITKTHHSVRDISMIFNNKSYEQYPDAQALVDMVGEQFKNQELQKVEIFEYSP